MHDIIIPPRRKSTRLYLPSVYNPYTSLHTGVSVSCFKKRRKKNEKTLVVAYLSAPFLFEVIISTRACVASVCVCVCVCARVRERGVLIRECVSMCVG